MTANSYGLRNISSASFSLMIETETSTGTGVPMTTTTATAAALLANTVTITPSHDYSLHSSSWAIMNDTLNFTSLRNASNVTLQKQMAMCASKSDPCSKDFDMYKVVIDVYLVLVICAFGFVGNILTVAVLRRDNEATNTTNWLLQSLAFTDSIYLLSALVIQVTTHH